MTLDQIFGLLKRAEPIKGHLAVAHVVSQQGRGTCQSEKTASPPGKLLAAACVRRKTRSITSEKTLLLSMKGALVGRVPSPLRGSVIKRSFGPGEPLMFAKALCFEV